ncbi:hypothetical protein DLAC_09967 [Tieghemostelium lacteum]|uniref:DNA-binding TFAR19-related protein n=1 Tax=Tieghemostelium lacteum TaxID=361077 RepID=A0A151Z5U4_TIELA|nr:hypothetical protein DLAC_09967 [Tieghemostelium lacteum]|eukprot:KYQ89308.1 hypothetical protein DLAC_09967 [Tieghemostelium lacteum]
MDKEAFAGLDDQTKQMQMQEQQRREMEERKKGMLEQILTVGARERLNRIAMVRPENAKAVGDIIIRAAQTGQITSQVDEQRLISLLEQLNESTKPKTNITFQRRTIDDDD